jgi:formylmethanofuran dehydrogenase subunit E
MSKISTCFVLIVLLALVAGLSACSNKSAQEEMVVCGGCGAEIDKKDAKIVGNQLMCSVCAAKLEDHGEAESQPEQGTPVVCSVCGMKMAADQMTQVEERWVCSHCLPSVQEGSAQQPHGEGHDH